MAGKKGSVHHQYIMAKKKFNASFKKYLRKELSMNPKTILFFQLKERNCMKISKHEIFCFSSTPAHVSLDLAPCFPLTLHSHFP